MEKKILEILSEVKPGVDFEGRTDLIDAGILASFDIISLVSELNDEFDVEISVVDLVPENFNSVEAMAKMIKRLEDEDSLKKIYFLLRSCQLSYCSIISYLKRQDGVFFSPQALYSIFFQVEYLHL